MQPHGIGNFLLENWKTIAAAIVWLTTQVIAIVRLGWTQVEHERRLKVLEDLITSHLSASNGQHRTPDFDRRFEDLADVLAEIQRDIKTLLKGH